MQKEGNVGQGRVGALDWSDAMYTMCNRSICDDGFEGW